MSGQVVGLYWEIVQGLIGEGIIEMGKGMIRILG